MNLLNLFEDNNQPGSNYAEELAYQIFKAAPDLDATGAADEVLDYAFDLAVNDLGRKRAHSLFAYDEDFDSDLVSAYAHLQRQGAEKEQVSEVDPRNFDSDEDYYAARNAPAKRRSAPSDYPYSPEEDDAYFREIFRKKREAAKKAAQDKESGVAEAGVGNRMSDMSVGSPKIVYKNGKAVGEIGVDHEASPGNGPYYMKHYETNTWYSGYDSKKAALADLKHVVDQMNEQTLDEGRVGEIAAEYEDYKTLSPREFYNMHKVTKQQWFAQHKGMLQQSNVVQGADLKTVAKANLGQNKLNLPAGYGDVVQPQKLNSVAEADKKKEDEPEVRDVALQRAISRAKADFPTAGTGIEALAKDFMRSQDQDSKSFDQLRQAERKQDQMLSQISKIDQEQEQEIQSLEQQNSTLASRLQQLQSVNSELEKKLASMSGRKAEKKSKTDSAPAPVATTTAAEPAKKVKAKSKNKPALQKSAMKSTAAQLAAPKADPMAAMSQRIQQGDSSVINKVTGQKSLAFEPSDNVLEPTITQREVNPKFAAAKANASDVDPRYYADIAKKVAGSPEQFKAAMSGVRENDEEEVDYSDKYQDMVARVGQKAREQEKKKPVDIADLARRLAAIDASKKDK